MIIPEHKGVYYGYVVLGPPELSSPYLQVERQLLVADTDQHELEELNEQKG